MTVYCSNLLLVESPVRHHPPVTARTGESISGADLIYELYYLFQYF